MKNERNEKDVEKEDTLHHKLSRRNLLTAIGTTGVLLGGGALINKISSLSVTDSVYPANTNGIHPRLPELLQQNFLIAVTKEELLNMTDPHPQYVYFLKEPGLEGYFSYDSEDTTSSDNGETVLVGMNGHRYKRMLTHSFHQRQLLNPPLLSAMADISGSELYTKGTIASGSSTLTVDSVIDFQIGQGILIAGASSGTKEVLSLVIEEAPILPGSITIQLPGEANKSVPVTASKEIVQIEITSPCTTSGHIALVLDNVEFLIPVENGDTPEQIAARIRSWFFEGWNNDGNAGSPQVSLTAINPGPKRDTFFYGQSTGVNANINLTKGNRSTPHSIAAAFRSQNFTNWETGGYNNSNVIFFISKNNGAMGGEDAVINFSSTGTRGRLEVVQYGNYLVSTITKIEGNTITISGTALNSVSGGYVGHDDTAAMQQALDQAAGNSLQLPPGIYKLSRPLKPASNTILRGAGHSTTVLQYQALGSGIEIDNNIHNVYVGYLQIKNTCSPDAYFGGSDSEKHGILLRYAKNTVIEHCKFDNCDDAAIRAGYDSGFGNSSGTRILYNVFANTAEGSAIEVIRGEDCLLIGNEIRRSAQHGIRLCGARKPIAIGNILEHNYDGFSLQGFGDGRNVTQRTQDFVIEGNIIKEHITYNIGIFNQVNSGLISNNVLDGHLTPTGINVRHVLINGRKSTNFDITIEGNLIKGFNRGMQIRGDQLRFIIRDNTFKNFSADGSSSAYGIYLNSDDDGDLKELVIEGNTFICPVKDKIGIRMFLPTANSLVHVHNNTFIMRFSNLAPERVAEYCVRNVASTGYNERAMISVKQGECTITLPDQTEIVGTTTQDTNVYTGIGI